MTYHLSVSDIPMTLIGTGNYTACRESLIPLLSSPKDTHKDDKDFITAAECSEDTLYELPINFTTMPFYGFSEFWYTMNDILGLGGAYERSSFDSHAAVSVLVSFFLHTIQPVVVAEVWHTCACWCVLKSISALLEETH